MLPHLFCSFFDKQSQVRNITTSQFPDTFVYELLRIPLDLVCRYSPLVSPRVPHNETTMTQVFHKPRADQSTSPLLGLPTELRVKIFRCLHKKGSVLSSEKADTSKEREVEDSDHQLSAQLLRVCQQAYVEGSAVLFNKNTLEIHVDSVKTLDLRAHFVRITILGHSIICPDKVEDLPVEYFSLHQYAKSPAEKQRHVRSCSHQDDLEAARWLVQVYPSIANIQRLEVVVGITDPYNKACTLILFRALRDLLRDKCVTLKSSDWANISANLASCRILRCRTFNLDTNSPCESDKGHVQKVMSQDPEHDTFEMWRSIRTFFNELRVGSRHFGTQHGREVRNVQDAAWSYDIAGYRHHEAIMMKFAHPWVAKHSPLKIREKKRAIKMVQVEADKTKELHRAAIVEVENLQATMNKMFKDYFADQKN